MHKGLHDVSFVITGQLMLLFLSHDRLPALTCHCGVTLHSYLNAPCAFFLHISRVPEDLQLKGVVLNCRLLYWAQAYYSRNRSSLGSTAPSALITYETAFALTFCVLCSCFFSPCCFSVFLPLDVSSLPKFGASNGSLFLHCENEKETKVSGY